jgi:hypothetical protein
MEPSKRCDFIIHFDEIVRKHQKITLFEPLNTSTNSNAKSVAGASSEIENKSLNITSKDRKLKKCEF